MIKCRKYVAKRKPVSLNILMSEGSPNITNYSTGNKAVQ